MSLSGLNGKTALVTGAGRGIGLATAARLAAEGCMVVAADRDAAPLEEAAERHGLIPLVADVASEDGNAALFADALRRLGHIDLLHLNAGVEGRVAPLEEATAADYELTFGVNVLGVLLGLGHGLRHMRERGGGAIAVTASLASLRGEPEFGVYVASKHAVVGLVRTAAIEGGAHGVRVNAVAPGQIETRMMEAIATLRAPGEEAAFRAGLSERVPLGRYGSPDEVAATVAWLLSDDSSFVNGALVSVDGGVAVR